MNGEIGWVAGEYFSTKSNCSVHYRSSWELKRFKLLDEDISVASWKYEPITIKYKLDGNERRYLPDFLIERVNGRFELEEMGVKEMKEGLEMNQAKLLEALSYCNASNIELYLSWFNNDEFFRERIT